MITLLFATDSSVTAVEIGFYDSTPAGTVMIDSEGNQTFYEHSSSEEVANYYSSWADVLVTPVINILLYKLINSSLQTIGNNKLLDYSYYTFNVFGSVFYYRLWPKYSQLINLPSIISKVHYHYMIHTRHTYSPLLIHRIFDPSQSRLFYRFIPVSMPRFLDNPNQIGMHPSFWKLDSELRRRNVYIELYAGSHAKSDHDDRTAVGEGSDHELDDTDQSAETGEDRYGGRYLVMDIYPLHSQHNDRLLLNRIHFKSSHQFTWLEELIYEFEWQKQKGAWEEGYQPVSINDLIANHEFESPLSPEWISHIAKWLMERKDRDLFNLNTKISQIYHGGPIQKHSEQCDQQMKGCFHRKIDPALETNGCLSLDLHQSRYYLPADLINQNQSVTSGYCHAVLAEPNEQLITAEHKAFNSDESERMFVVNDLWKTLLSIAVSFGLKHVSKLFDVKNPPNPDKNRGSMILAVSRTPRVKEFPQTFPGIIKALDQSDASSGVNIQEPELDALEVHNKGDATTSKVDHEPDVDQVQEPAHGVLQGTRDQPIHHFVNQEEGSGESLFTDKSKISADSATEHTEVKLLAFVSSSYGESDTESAQGFSDQKKSKSSEVVGKEINTDSVLLDTQSDAMMDVIQKDLTSEAEGTGVTEVDESALQKQIEQVYTSDSKAGAESDVAKSESVSLASQSSDGETESGDTWQEKRDDLNELMIVSSRDSVDTQSDEVQFDIPTSDADPKPIEMGQIETYYTAEQEILHVEPESDSNVEIQTVVATSDSISLLSRDSDSERKSDIEGQDKSDDSDNQELDTERVSVADSAEYQPSIVKLEAQASNAEPEPKDSDSSEIDETVVQKQVEQELEDNSFSSTQKADYIAADSDVESESSENSVSDGNDDQARAIEQDFTEEGLSDGGDYQIDELATVNQDTQGLDVVNWGTVPKLKLTTESTINKLNVKKVPNKRFEDDRENRTIAFIVNKLLMADSAVMPLWSDILAAIRATSELSEMTERELASLERRYQKASVTGKAVGAWFAFYTNMKHHSKTRFDADHEKMLKPRKIKKGISGTNFMRMLTIGRMSLKEQTTEPLITYIGFMGPYIRTIPLLTVSERENFLQENKEVFDSLCSVLDIDKPTVELIHMVKMGIYPVSKTIEKMNIEKIKRRRLKENDFSIQDRMDKFVNVKTEALERIKSISEGKDAMFHLSKDDIAERYRKEQEFYTDEVVTFFKLNGSLDAVKYNRGEVVRVLKKLAFNCDQYLRESKRSMSILDRKAKVTKLLGYFRGKVSHAFFSVNGLSKDEVTLISNYFQSSEQASPTTELQVNPELLKRLHHSLVILIRDHRDDMPDLVDYDLATNVQIVEDYVREVQKRVSLQGRPASATPK